MTCFCEHGNETLGFIKCVEFFLTSGGAVFSGRRPPLGGVSCAIHCCELSNRIALTLQFVQASALCNKIQLFSVSVFRFVVERGF